MDSMDCMQFGHFTSSMLTTWHGFTDEASASRKLVADSAYTP